MINVIKIYGKFICWSVMFFLLLSCKKLIQLPSPVGQTVTGQVFSTDAQASSAAAGMYYDMANIGYSFSSAGMTILAGMSADELRPFDQVYADQYVQFQENSLTSQTGIVYGSLWTPPFDDIYMANAIISGLSDYSGVHDSVKNELIGEAEFVRAFCNFYLVNMYGPVPLVETINYQKTSDLPRATDSAIYQSIVKDLQDAQKRLAKDFSIGHGQRIIPNSWAATALLARVYLYEKDWADAEVQASAVISDNTDFSLVTDLNGVYLINSTEAIWQLQQDVNSHTFNATFEGSQFIPISSTSRPAIGYITPQLLSAFEQGDMRRFSWIDSTDYNGVIYYYPYKYKTGPAQESAGASATEFYMVLRLGEQYLIRAEARAKLGDLNNSLGDLNTIRLRAGLPPINSSDEADILSDIYQERRIEMMCEWGSRWFDLKRTGLATPVLSQIKSLWTPNAELYPIPASELSIDPALIQNPGY